MAKSNLIDLPLEPKDVGVIQLLEDILEKAKVGEISAVAIAIVHRDGCTGSMNSYLHNNSLMLGAVSRLQQHLLMKDYE